MSMKSPSSVHSATSSACSSTSLRERPAASPPRMMFSRPVRFLLKPTPRASRVLARPHTSIRPEDGGRIPAIARIRVDLPAPLAPMMPIAVPVRTSKLTCLSALTSFTARWPRPNRTSAWRSVGLRSNEGLYVMERSSTRPAGGGPAGAAASGLPVQIAVVSGSVAVLSGSDETDTKITLPRHAEQEPGDQPHQGDGRGDDPGHRTRHGGALHQIRVPGEH